MTLSSPSLCAAWAADIDAITAAPLPWEALSGLRVAVTGATGLLGNYLVRTLLGLHPRGLVTAPLRVEAVVRSPERARERFADLLDRPELSILTWDFTTLAVPPLADPHLVFHAASQASPSHYGRDPVGTILPNAVGTAALLEALRRASDPRGLMFVSSGAVYGQISSEEALDEHDLGPTDPARVNACYTEGKRLGETLCVAWTHQHGLPTWLVRPFHTYGPGLEPTDGRAFADFLFHVLRHEDLVLNSDGMARRVFCYAADATAGFFTVLLRGEPAQPYNVANPAGLCSMRELAETLVALAPGRDLRVVLQPPAGDARLYTQAVQALQIPDVRRLEALGWRATTDVRTGFARTLAAYRG